MVLAIPESEGRYTRSDKKILEFIEESTEEFLFMSIGQLAERLEMSEATISRFARHIGYGDFKELKSAVAQQKNGKGAARKMAGTLMKGEGFDIESWFSYQQECMMRTLADLDQREFIKALDQIGDARRIFIHAKNASAAAGQLLFFRLRRMGFPVQMIPSGGSEVLEGLAQAGEEDLVILFSYSKVSEEGKMILDYAGEAGYNTLAFTSRKYAPKEQRSDVNLYVYRGEKKEYHSMTAAVAVVDALVLALSERSKETIAASLIRVQKLKEHYGAKR